MSDGFEVDRHHGGHAKLSLESRRAHQEVVAPSLPVMEFELVEVVFPARSDVQEVQEKPVRSLRSRVFASVPRARSDAGFYALPAVRELDCNCFARSSERRPLFWREPLA